LRGRWSRERNGESEGERGEERVFQVDVLVDRISGLAVHLNWRATLFVNCAGSMIFARRALLHDELAPSARWRCMVSAAKDDGLRF
jgi:hypothetical protein